MTSLHNYKKKRIGHKIFCIEAATVCLPPSHSPLFSLWPSPWHVSRKRFQATSKLCASTQFHCLIIPDGLAKIHFYHHKMGRFWTLILWDFMTKAGSTHKAAVSTKKALSGRDTLRRVWDAPVSSLTFLKGNKIPSQGFCKASHACICVYACS